MVEKKQTASKVSNTKYLHWILLIVLIVALAVGAKVIWMQYNGQNSFLKQEILYLENKIASLTGASTAAAPSLQKFDETAVSDLQVRDAYFMARIAATILQNDQDIASAKDLLTTAQEHLSNLQGEKIDQVKQILAADIDKLNNAQLQDTHQLQQKLVELDKLVNILPLKHETVEPAASTVNKNVSTTEAQGKWAQSWNSVVTEAKSIVKVRKKAANEGHDYAATIEIKRAQFKLLIEQIRWALFYKEAEVYKNSITKAQQLLPEVFDSNSDSVKKFAEILTELSKSQLNGNVPNIQDSVTALKALIVG